MVANIHVHGSHQLLTEQVQIIKAEYQHKVDGGFFLLINKVPSMCITIHCDAHSIAMLFLSATETDEES